MIKTRKNKKSLNEAMFIKMPNYKQYDMYPLVDDSGEELVLRYSTKKTDSIEYGFYIYGDEANPNNAYLGVSIEVNGGGYSYYEYEIELNTKIYEKESEKIVRDLMKVSDQGYAQVVRRLRSHYKAHEIMAV